MLPEASRLFHLRSKNTGEISVPRDSSLWPKEWKEVEYKTYSRFPSYDFPKTDPPTANLFDLLLKRKSERTLRSSAPSKEILSLLLRYACGERDTEQRRMYPSGGARYPIEVYPILLSKGEFPAGAYHYNVQQHSLEHVHHTEIKHNDLFISLPGFELKDVSFAVILTAVFDRTQRKYKERGYRLALLEAGHIMQNFLLVSTALGLKSCPMGGTKDVAIEALLDIDGETESLVYGAVFG